MDPIIVIADDPSAEAETTFADGDESSPGKTVLKEDQLEKNVAAGGDVNSNLMLLPHVQWKNHVNNAIGITSTGEQDLKPLELSISGAPVWSNTITLDGISINTLGNGLEDSSATLQDRLAPSANTLYALHSQSVFVPTSLVKTLSVENSNISARHGGFQGGFAELETISPNTGRWSGFVEAKATGSPLTAFLLATENGDNPHNVKHLEFRKAEGAIGISGPINEQLAILSSVSKRYADTKRQRNPQFIDENIATSTNHIVFLNKAKLDTDIGLFKLSNKLSFYDQQFESHAALLNRIDLTGDGSSTVLSYENTWQDALGASLLNLEIDGYFNTSEQGKYEQENVYVTTQSQDKNYNYSGAYKDKCRELVGIEKVSCNFGGGGDLLQEEQAGGFNFAADMTFKKSTVSFGGGINRILAQRTRPYDYTLYSSTKYASPTNSFTCTSPNDPNCYSNDIYSARKTVFQAYKIPVTVTTANFWAETEFSISNLDIRSGLRVDYDNYQNNLNIAPRLKASWQANDYLTFTGGANRYYDDNTIAYAIAASRPNILAYKRSPDASGNLSNEHNVEAGWQQVLDQAQYQYDATKLKTPYNNELALGVNFNEPFFGGVLAGKLCAALGPRSDHSAQRCKHQDLLRDQ